MGKPIGIQSSTHTQIHGGFYPWPHGYTLQNEPLFVQNGQELNELWAKQLFFFVLLITQLYLTVLDEQRLDLKLAGRRISTHTRTRKYPYPWPIWVMKTHAIP